MISILIPVFNRDITTLAERLREQISRQSAEIDVVIMDDASDRQVIKAANGLAVHHIPGFRYIELVENAGRNLVRQRLAAAARHPVYIFLDADSGFPDENWLDRYMEVIGKPGVFPGGRVYRPPAPGQKIHYQHGRSRETASALRRNVHPYRSFMTNNFLITRHDFEQLVVDPQLKGYGHEDTFIGMQLEKLGIPVTHLENPVYHEAIEEDVSFMQKQEEALRNLGYLYQSYRGQYNFRKNIRLLNVYDRCIHSVAGRVLLAKIAKGKTFFRERLLASGKLLWLDLWKLAAFHDLMQQRKS